MNNIIAVIVLFNPRKQDLQNMISLSKIYSIICVDNTIDNQLNKNQLQSIKNIYYIGDGINKGLAKALNIGCDYAINLEYKLTILLDQDTEISEYCVEQMCELIRVSDDIALVGPNINKIYYLNGEKIIDKKPIYSNKIEETNFIITSGSILRLAIFSKIRFDEKLFISQVDQDYCARAIEKGYRVVRYGSVFMNQELGIPKKIYIPFKGKTIIGLQTKMRYYYLVRNELYLRNKHRNHDYYHKVPILKNIIFILMFESSKMTKLYMCFKGAVNSMKIIFYEKGEKSELGN